MRNRKEPVTGKRFLAVEELEAWNRAEKKHFWAPNWELVDAAAGLNLIIDLPPCGPGDIELAILPRVIFLKQKVRLLASRNWQDVGRALFGAGELFRRFDLPASIDVNRVTAELEMGVLTITAPKAAATGEPAKGVPGQPKAFAA